MKLIVAGSRSFGKYAYDHQQMDFVLDAWHESSPVTEVVSGTAQGADKAGEYWAHMHGIIVKQFPADWKVYGKSAGHKRNAAMADYADAAIVFWDGRSKGSENMIEQMHKRRKRVQVVFIHVKPLAEHVEKS